MTEEEIKRAFIEEVNKLLDIKEEVIGNLNHLLELISDTANQDALWCRLDAQER